MVMASLVKMDAQCGNYNTEHCILYSELGKPIAHILNVRNRTFTFGKEGSSMTALLKRMFADESAQDLAEYGIALAVIGLVAGAAAVFIAGDVGTLWSNAQSIIDKSANPGG